MRANMISNYFTTDYDSLLRTTEQLFEDLVLQSYLTNEQNLIMYTLLKIEDYPRKLSYWKNLLNGKLNLELTLVDAISNSHSEETSTDVESKTAEDDDEFIKMDLLNLQERLSSDGFASALSLKVRYCLWEQPLNMWLQNAFKDGKLLEIYDEFKQVGLFDNSNESNELLKDARYVLFKSKSNGEMLENANLASTAQAASEAAVKFVTENKKDDDSDDYDMEDDNSEPVNDDEKTDSKPSEKNENQTLPIAISKDTLSLLLTESVNNDKKKIVSRFNDIYHTIEDDKTTVLGKIQLKESEKRMENKHRKRKRFQSDDEEEEDDDEDDKETRDQVDSLRSLAQNTAASNENLIPETNPNMPIDGSVGLVDQKESVSNGEVNSKKKNKKLKVSDKDAKSDLQISHLLSVIEENRSKLGMTDQELRKLLSDVQRTGSKWASDKKIGQEELYEACEKVLNQLRSYGSYCQPFMNKVSKREAPNYYDIIKQPMDLNTVLRKLRNIRYQSKQEFVDDLNLIWKNCLTYNSDTKLLIRRDCSMMQKKAASLISSIPDITIRDRKDVDSEYLEEDEEESKLKDAGGITLLSSKNRNKFSPEGGKKVNRNISGKQRSLASADGIEEPPHNGNAENHLESNNSLNGVVSAAENSPEKEANTLPEVESEKSEPLDREAKNSKAADEEDIDDDDEEEEENDDDEDDVQDIAYLKMLNAEQLAFIDDVELTTWKNMTSNARSEILLNRSQMFIGNKLNPLADALLRNNKKMKDDSQWLLDYDNELNLLQKRNVKNGANSQQNGHSPDDSVNDDNGTGDLEDVKIGTDNLFFLNEYNITSNLPPLPYSSITNCDLENIENFIVSQNLKRASLSEDSQLNKSVFAENRDIGMNNKMNTNIKLIQEIRHICHKISLIRELQNRQAALIASANNPNTKSAAAIKTKVFKPSIFRKLDVDSQVDLDYVSTLPTRNAGMDKNLIESMMFKINSRIAMDSGFESTERSAISTLNEISATYIENLIKTIKMHQESTSVNKIADENELLEVALLQNGILRPDMLYSYYEKNFVKKQRKLKDIKYKLKGFLKKLLRPSLKTISERNFDDESSSFLTGDFSSELTGDDFFGFKELGLDKEFNIMNKSIPLHLLAVQMADVTSGSAHKSIKLESKEMEYKYKDLHVGDLDSDIIVGLMKPCLHDQWQLNQKVLNIKPESFEELSLEEKNATVIKADEELPLKLKAVRLATNGRIALMKKKNISDTILLPEEPVQSIQEKGIEGTKKSGGESTTVSKTPEHPNGDGLFLPTIQNKSNQSYGLVVPKIE